MFHFNFPSTTSSQSWKQKERITWSFISDLENPSSDPLLFFFFPQEMAQQHFSTFPLLAVSYYLHAFLIPRILCVHIASMWQALPCSEALPMKHPAPSFLSQACSGHNELAAASSSSQQQQQHTVSFCTRQKKGARLLCDSISCARCVKLNNSPIHWCFLMFSCLALMLGGARTSSQTEKHATARLPASLSEQTAVAFCRGGRSSQTWRIGPGVFEFGR